MDFVCKTQRARCHCYFFYPPHPLLPKEPTSFLFPPLECPKELSAPLLNEHGLALCALLEVGSVLLGSDFSVGGRARGVKAALDLLFHRLTSQLSRQILI